MARLLLESARMKVVWALLPLLASSGCLFVDDLNHPPTVTIHNALSSVHKGATLMIEADGQDAEDDPTTLRYALKVAPLGPDAPALDQFCDYELAQSGNVFSVSFFRTGNFDVTVTVTDSQGAPTSTDVMVTITDDPPLFDSGATVQQTSTPQACNNAVNAAGDVITIGLATSTKDVPAVDDDDSMAHASNAGCFPTETLTYIWRIKDSSPGAQPALTIFDGTNCAPRTPYSGTAVHVASPTTQVCLYTDPNLQGAAAQYNVVMDVSDGRAPVESPVAVVSVMPNQLPCVTGTEPVTGSYVVDRTQPQTFEVTGAVDDRDQFGDPNGITFAWSVYREADMTWRDVPDWNLSTYTLDLSSFGVGEKLRVRVEALDRQKQRVPQTTCSLDVADCPVTSCASGPNVCNKWKTWDLELR